MRNVIVSLASNSIAARECFIGVFNCVNAGLDWNIKIISSPYDITPETLAEARRTGIDGILTGVSRDTPGFRALVRSGLPCVFINVPPDWSPRPQDPVVVLHNDEQAIGRRAAEFFLAKGAFRSYGYVPSDDPTFWSTYRNRGYREVLAAAGHNAHTYRKQSASLADWIAALPKPTAIFAVSDQTAIKVIETCQQLKLKIPAQVAILGVDNDELYCNNCRPTLSSIHPNHVELGRLAAEKLERLMRRRKTAKNVFVPPIDIVERETTRTIPPAGRLIEDALAFILRHHPDGITARDVARHLHVSPSLLRLRFREVQGKSVCDIIQDVRLASARKLVARTKLPMAVIAAKCGFVSASRLAHAFRRRLGAPPSDYRPPRPIQSSTSAK